METNSFLAHFHLAFIFVPPTCLVSTVLTYAPGHSITAKNPQVDSSLLQVCNRFEDLEYNFVNYLDTIKF